MGRMAEQSAYRPRPAGTGVTAPTDFKVTREGSGDLAYFRPQQLEELEIVRGPQVHPELRRGDGSRASASALAAVTPRSPSKIVSGTCRSRARAGRSAHSEP